MGTLAARFVLRIFQEAAQTITATEQQPNRYAITFTYRLFSSSGVLISGVVPNAFSHTGVSHDVHHAMKSITPTPSEGISDCPGTRLQLAQPGPTSLGSGASLLACLGSKTSFGRFSLGTFLSASARSIQAGTDVASTSASNIDGQNLKGRARV